MKMGDHLGQNTRGLKQSKRRWSSGFKISPSHVYMRIGEDPGSTPGRRTTTTLFVADPEPISRVGFLDRQTVCCHGVLF